MEYKNYYLTTPLYYVNATPHLGTAYATIIPDILARYHKLFGRNTRFLTGTDEHGQKIQQAAEKRGIEPIQHCDEYAEKFQRAWDELDINFNIFYRTTSPNHYKVVSKALDKLHSKGDIYSQEYSGWYCVGDETFYPEKDLINGKSPTGKEVEWVSEKNYFFKMSKYQDQLIKYIQDNPTFIQPDSKKNEVLGFLKQSLEDLSISRPKERVAWGIPLPFDQDHVTYVWVDALLNYASGAGFLQDGREKEFDKWWNEGFVQHIIGKDILITHSIYWTTLLMALGVRLPNQIFAHGYILNSESEKMSKSMGDTMNPSELCKKFGLDQVRYYLASEIRFGNDAPISYELIANKVNADLSNNFGNMVSRTFNLIQKYFDGVAPHLPEDDSIADELEAMSKELPNKVLEFIDQTQPSEAIKEVLKFLTRTNQYLEETAPWKLAKKGETKKAGEVLRVALEVLRVSAVLLYPVIPNKADELLNLLGIKLNPEGGFKEAKIWDGIAKGQKLEKIAPLFPRIDLEKP